MMHLPEAIVTEILARLPLRSISRFKSVCKAWMWTIGSAYFRRLFVSMHQNTCSSWSLMRLGFMGKELMGFHGCETWDLPKSPASYIPSFPDIPTDAFAMSASSNGLVLMQGIGYGCFVGNPILQQWVEIPIPTYLGVLDLVTSVDQDGVVLGFKVISFGRRISTWLEVHIYSSETGTWSCKRILHPFFHIPDIVNFYLNATLYLLSQTDFEFSEPSALLSHDFNSLSHHFRVIPLPDHSNPNYRKFKKALSTSGGYITYIKTLPQQLDLALKVWKLNNDERWQLLWDVRLPFAIGYYAPLATHPSETHVVYIWSQQICSLLSFNLTTLNYRIIRDPLQHVVHQDGSINTTVCEACMDQIRGPLSVWHDTATITLSQFVLPRWMESLPRPPRSHMIDTTSFVSYVISRHRPN